jgi:hypothetical protein
VSLVGPVRDRVRTLLKIRVERHLPVVGYKPAIGARIFRGDLRMTVQAGMSEGLWRWLVHEGWREITFRPDRRRYRDLPATYVTQLIDCPSDHRERVLAAAIANAVWRPVFDRRGTWANTRGR